MWSFLLQALEALNTGYAVVLEQNARAGSVIYMSALHARYAYTNAVEPDAPGVNTLKGMAAYTALLKRLTQLTLLP